MQFICKIFAIGFFSLAATGCSLSRDKTTGKTTIEPHLMDTIREHTFRGWRFSG